MLMSFIVSLIAYPMVSILLAFIYIGAELINKRINYKMFIAPILLVMTALIIYNFNLNLIIETITFEKGWTVGFEHFYGLFELVSPILYIFFIIGLFKLIKEKKYLLLLTLIPIINILTYYYFNISYFLPYQRSLIYSLISISLIAGIGAYYLFEILIEKKTFKKISRPFVKKKIKKKHYKIYNIIMIFALTILILTFSFKGYYEIENEAFRMIHWASEENVEVFTFVKENYGEENKIMTEPNLNFIASPISKGTVVAAPPSNLQSGNMREIHDFFRRECIYRNNTVERLSIDLIVTRQDFDCGYEKEKVRGFYIYKPKK